MKNYILTFPVELLTKLNLNSSISLLNQEYKLSFVQKIPKLSGTLSNLLSSLDTVQTLCASREKLLASSNDFLSTILNNFNEYKDGYNLDFTEYIQGLHWDTSLIRPNSTLDEISATLEKLLLLFHRTLCFYKDQIKLKNDEIQKIIKVSRETNLWYSAKNLIEKSSFVLNSEYFETFVIAIPKSKITRTRRSFNRLSKRSMSNELNQSYESPESDEVDKYKILLEEFEQWDDEIVEEKKLKSKVIVPNSLDIVLDLKNHMVGSFIFIRKFKDIVINILKRKGIDYRQVGNIYETNEKEHQVQTLNKEKEVYKTAALNLCTNGWKYIDKFYVHSKITEAVAESLLKYGLNYEPIVLILSGSNFEMLNKMKIEIDKGMKEMTKNEMSEIVLLEL